MTYASATHSCLKFIWKGHRNQLLRRYNITFGRHNHESSHPPRSSSDFGLPSVAANIGTKIATDTHDIATTVDPHDWAQAPRRRELLQREHTGVGNS